jgi:hypothetical protein
MYYLNKFFIVQEAVMYRYNRWKSLNELVSKRQKNKFLIFVTSFKMIMQAFYISFLQYMNNTIRKLDHKTYEVTYVIDGKTYKMIVVPKRGPAPILQISNDEDEDVTEEILPYMGPQYDWHCKNITPRFFGYKSLTFQLCDGTEQTHVIDHDVPLFNSIPIQN